MAVLDVDSFCSQEFQMLLDQLPSELISDISRINWTYSSSVCNNCGKSGAICCEHELYCDFHPDSSTVYYSKLKHCKDGLCLNCGHFQRYSIFTAEELDAFLADYADKDDTSIGVISGDTDVGKNECVARTELISRFLLDYKHVNRPSSIYIARPSCVEAITSIRSSMPGSRICFSENRTAVKTKILEKYKDLEGGDFGADVHGRLTLDDRFGCYIIIHCLQHVLDLGGTIDNLISLAQSGKPVLLLEEVQRKLHNPFHINHLSEHFLIRLLCSKGANVELIHSSILASKYLRGLQTSNYVTGVIIHG